MKKTFILSMLAVSLLTVSCGKKERPIREHLYETPSVLEETTQNSTLEETAVPETVETAAPKAEGERQVPVKLAKTKIGGSLGKYFEVVQHDDYFIDVPANPGLLDKMSISLEIRRIAEGWPNGWTPDKKPILTYIHFNVENKRGKKLLGTSLLDVHEELDGLNVGESNWYSLDLSDGHGGFKLSDEDLESIDRVVADDSELLPDK